MNLNKYTKNNMFLRIVVFNTIIYNIVICLTIMFYFVFKMWIGTLLQNRYFLHYDIIIFKW